MTHTEPEIQAPAIPVAKATRPKAIVDAAIETLRPSPNNPRVHSRRQIKLLARSIDRFGFVNPILIDANNRIIAGHGRVLAAQQVGRKTVPAIKIEHLSKDEIRAYIIADNRLAEKAGWDNELLSIELQGLVELGFDVQEIGFETAEIDIVFEAAAQAAGAITPDDETPDLGSTPVSKPNDLWHCGRHRLTCGDALDQAAYDRTLNGQKADLVVTDPPYNVPIKGHVCGLGATQHREFAMACGEMNETEFTDFLERSFWRMAENSIDGSIHHIFMDWRHTFEMMRAGRNVYSELKNVCVWCKTNAGMGSFYRSQHEFVFVWCKGGDAHINNIELGSHGRSRSNVWTYAGVTSFKHGRADEIRMHPTVKPVALVADAIKDCTHRGGIVLDPFAGSGTVLIAAEQTGRMARAIEMDPIYVDVAVRRWQSYTGKFAVHSDTGLTFEQMEENRADAGFKDAAP